MRLIYRGILPAVLGLYKGRPRGVRAERFEGVIGGSPVPPLPSWASCRAVPGRFGGGFSNGSPGLDPAPSPCRSPCYDPLPTMSSFDPAQARQSIEQRNRLRKSAN